MPELTRQLLVEIRIHLVELHGEHVSPRLATKRQVPLAGLPGPFPVELESRLQQHRRLNGTAKGVTLRARAARINRGHERPPVAGFALHEAEVRHLAQDSQHGRQLDIEQPHDFLLRDLHRQLAGVACSRNRNEQLLVFLVLRIDRIDIRDAGDRLEQYKPTIGPCLDTTLVRQQLQRSADRRPRHAELAAQVLLDEMMSRAGALLIQRAQNAPGQLSLQWAGIRGFPRSGGRALGLCHVHIAHARCLEMYSLAAFSASRRIMGPRAAGRGWLAASAAWRISCDADSGTADSP